MAIIVHDDDGDDDKDDEDGDGHEVLIEIVAETAPSIVLLTCSKTAPAPGPGTCSWTFPDELPPFYRTEERYRLQMTLSSTNASPAGDRTPLNFMLAEGLSVPSREVPATLEDDASNAASAVVWVGLLGVLAGAGVARWTRQRNRQRNASNEPPPFSAAGNQQNASLHDSSQNDER